MSRGKTLFVGVLLGAVVAGLMPVSSPAETVYFVVARPELYPFGLGDSYILPLTDPDDIAFARELVAGGGFRIVGATVVAGADGINRNWVAPGRPEWSWHVSSFDSFAEAAIELCDGTPTYTEGEAPAWTPGIGHQICYWEYTVVDEVDIPTPTADSTWGRIKALY